MSTYFWEEWKDKTKLEEKAISSVEQALKTLFEHVNKEKIYSIYIKGSFPRREMNEKSDVDVIVITKNNETLREVKKLEESKGREYKPSELIPHSLEELKEGKRHLSEEKPKGGVDGLIREIHRYEIIYGSPVKPEEYKIRTDKEFLEAHIKAFNEVFIPLYREGKFGFQEIVKQIFFLTEKEVLLEGKEPPETWKELVESIKDKNHVVHDAYKHRAKPTKNEAEREKLIRKLEEHLEEDKKWMR